MHRMLSANFRIRPFYRPLVSGFQSDRMTPQVRRSPSSGIFRTRTQAIWKCLGLSSLLLCYLTLGHPYVGSFITSRFALNSERRIVRSTPGFGALYGSSTFRVRFASLYHTTSPSSPLLLDLTLGATLRKPSPENFSHPSIEVQLIQQTKAGASRHGPPRTEWWVLLASSCC